MFPARIVRFSLGSQRSARTAGAADRTGHRSRCGARSENAYTPCLRGGRERRVRIVLPRGYVRSFFPSFPFPFRRRCGPGANELHVVRQQPARCIPYQANPHAVRTCRRSVQVTVQPWGRSRVSPVWGSARGCSLPGPVPKAGGYDKAAIACSIARCRAMTRTV